MKFRIVYLEAERGWGQKYETGLVEYSTYEEVKSLFDEEMKQFLATAEDRAPDYYYRVDHIEESVDGVKWTRVGG